MRRATNLVSSLRNERIIGLKELTRSQLDYLNRIYRAIVFSIIDEYFLKFIMDGLKDKESTEE